jgi:hypothetical protein
MSAYGAAVLGSPLIVVLAHTSCGAVKAACDVVTKNATYPGAIGPNRSGYGTYVANQLAFGLANTPASIVICAANMWGARGCYLSKAVTFCEVVDAGNNKVVRADKIFRASGPVTDWH